MVKLSGGDKFNATLSRLANNVGNASSVEIGFLENSTYPDGKPTALIASIQEFGAPARNIPPRPFFRQMITAKSGEWPKAVADLLKANDFDAALTLDQTGAAIAGQLRQSIVDFSGVPLSPKTIARKGFDKQLVDTGHMLDSIDHAVKE